MDENVMFLTLFWLYHIAACLVLSSPFVVFGRKRACWQWWDCLALVIPYWLWVALIFTGSKEKNMANLGEFWLISLLVAMAAIARVVTGNNAGQTQFKIIFFLLICGTTAIYAFMPVLGVL